MMSKRSRAVAAARWGGLAALVALAAIWVASGWWGASFVWNKSDGLRAVVVAKRSWWLIEDSGGSLVVPVRLTIYRLAGASDPLRVWESRPGWPAPGSPSTWRKHSEEHLGVWVIWLAIALPTALLWLGKLRVPPGHCPKCRYDLRRTMAGRCPECGAAVHVAGNP